MANKLDLIWQMGVASLTSTGNELRLPLAISNNMNAAELNELENRLSKKFANAATFMFADHDLQVFRICAVPKEVHHAASPLSSFSSAASSPSASPSSSASPTPDFKNRVYGKKAKIPRPPNAFILYRQKMHPTIKQENPNLHNNDLSIIIGRKWKAETDSVRDQYKQLAENIKIQHAIDNPGYQYAPRKPSEKKRRMTARKLAQAAHDQSENVGIANQQALPSFNDVLGINRSANNSTNFTSNGSVQFNLPSAGEQSINALNPFGHPNGQQLVHALPNPLFNTSMPAHVAMGNQFGNSLVDWDELDAFTRQMQHLNDLVFESNGVAVADIAEVDQALPYLSELDEAELAAFNAQLDLDIQTFE